MREKVIFADDDEGFCDYIKERATREGFTDIVFCTKLTDVRDALDSQEVSRIILDQVFLGEQQTGLDVLEYAARTKSETERFLITGVNIDDSMKARLNRAEARIVDKDVLKWDAIEKLLSGEEAVGQPPDSPLKQTDVGLLNLRLEEIDELFRGEKAKRVELKELVDRLAHDDIADILRRLGPKNTSPDTVLIVGNTKYSMAQICDAVENMEPPGVEWIALHRELVKFLERRGKA